MSILFDILFQVEQSVRGIHGPNRQFAAINFLENLVFQFFVSSIQVVFIHCAFRFINLNWFWITCHMGQISEFSPLTASAMGLPKEFHEQCEWSMEVHFLKVIFFWNNLNLVRAMLFIFILTRVSFARISIAGLKLLYLILPTKLWILMWLYPRRKHVQLQYAWCFRY